MALRRSARLALKPRVVHTATGILDTFVGYCEDDLGVRCWEFTDAGYISEADYYHVSRAYVSFIEGHEEFKEWKEQCNGCLSTVEECDCDDRDYD